MRSPKHPPTPARLLAVPLVLSVLLAPARAQGTVEAAEPSASVRQEGSETPRGSIAGFLETARAGDYEHAADYLDLSKVPESDRREQGPRLAQELKSVLDRTLWIDLERMSDAPEGDLKDGLESRDAILGTRSSPRWSGVLYLERVRGEDGALVWKVSAQTVARIPPLYDIYGSGLLDHLPRFLVEETVFEIYLWQWIGLLILLFAAYVVAWVAATVVVSLLRPLVRRSQNDLDDKLLSLSIGPLRLLVAVGVFSACLRLLGLALPAQNVFHGIATLLAVAGVAWLIFRIIDLFAELVAERIRERGQGSVVYLVPIGARALKLAVAITTLLAALDNIGFDVTTIIAGLGIGGLAIALAAQKTLENVFGGIAILTDQPVKPGEQCRYGDKIGTVEEIGLRSTRVRSAERSIVSIPNAEFSTLQIENLAKRDRTLLRTQIGLRCETSPDQLRHVIGELRRLIHSHPRILPEACRVRFVGFGASSLDVEIFGYVDTTDGDEFFAIREDVYLRILDVVAESGTSLALPSSTVHMARDGGLDAEKARAAEAQVAEWRRKSDLMFPEFAAEEIAGMEDALDYPPKGSALAGTKRESPG